MTDSEDYKRVLSNGMRVSEPYSISKQSEYVRRVTEEIRASPREKIPGTTTQAPSTVMLLEAQKNRPECDDAAYWKMRRDTPIDPKAQLRHEDGTINHGTRSLGIDEVLLVEDTRRKSKNAIGQSEEGSVDAQKRERGIQAFTYSRPADLSQPEIDRVKVLGGMDAVIAIEKPRPKPEEKKVSWLRRLFSKHFNRRADFGVNKDWDWRPDGKGGRVRVEHDPD